MLDILHAIPTPIIVLNEDATIFNINHAGEVYFSVLSKHILKKDCHEFFHPSHLSKTECPLCLAIQNKQNVEKLELDYKDKTLQYDISFTSLESKLKIIHLCTDISKVHQQKIEIEKLNQRMSLAFKGYKAGMYEWNMIDHSAYISPEWKMMLGYSKDEPFAQALSTWKNRVHPEDIDKVMQGVQETLSIHETYIESTHRLKHKDGHWIWILGRGYIHYNDEGVPLYMVGIHTDISEMVSFQKESEEKRKILDNSLNEIYIFDADTLKFLYINKGAEQNTGYNLDEIRHFTPLDLLPNMAREYFSYLLESGDKNADSNTSFSTQCRRKNGTQYDIEVYLQKTMYEDSNAYVAIGLDITERKKTETLVQKQAKTLHHLAHHDTLTGLSNRLLLTDKLRHSVQKAKQYQTRLALLFIDVNNFKKINDLYGHTVGDTVLKEIAQRLKQSIRKEDTLSRFGGDEFVILLEEVKGVSFLNKKIQNVFIDPIHADGESFFITCSIGISIYPDNASTMDGLLKDADHRMYVDKRKKASNT